MTARILNLVDVLPETAAKQDVVETLKALTDLAAKGQIVSLGVAAVTIDGGGLWMMTEPTPDTLRLLGAATKLTHAISGEINNGW
jgi:hypothetical protein